MDSRCQVDLIDMQSQADNEFKFIIVYQDHLINFVLLQPLQSERVEEVVVKYLIYFGYFGLLAYFGYFGLLDNGREFVNSVIEQAHTYWPELKIVHGTPRHSQSQRSLERANQEIENMLALWLKNNKTSKWSSFCPIHEKLSSTFRN
ncbi:KRAB-A domain-containing protein 2-like [Argiope bruennichi]|uniref:KRAB-A domain-containing protein 2-like n=1 Tax=Argiope bruennichi TaxID=94029 RepID=UPI00249591D9|nr:KRAB-A domain-containing protein 2-like [Argiope bruennichi]